ncbi:MAG: sugar phosphate isomerase/epimerase [Clostridia bacterium]|nr:sugar phosphate isomerase/epimerase [Clostridia bacterium]
MAKFILSAFADEYSPEIDRQIEGLKKNGIGFMEIRGVDGVNISDITLEKAGEVHAKLKAAGIGVSSIGSPIGKIKLTDDFDAHVEKFRHTIKIAKILECDRIRMFSFYIPDTHDLAPVRDAVMERLGALLQIAEEEGVILCHENERGIYGETVEGCVDILRTFEGRIKCVFDHANFIVSGIEAFPYAFDVLCDDIFYMHIKDAGHAVDGSMQIFPAGEGAGNFEATFRRLNAYDKTFYCTLEPHLKVFGGLDALEAAKHDGLVKNQFATNEEAFCAAADAIKRYL